MNRLVPHHDRKKYYRYARSSEVQMVWYNAKTLGGKGEFLRPTVTSMCFTIRLETPLSDLASSSTSYHLAWLKVVVIVERIGPKMGHSVRPRSSDSVPSVDEMQTEYYFVHSKFLLHDTGVYTRTH